ncbi:hypothetical protein Poli38472_011835 [Pythium oligandrum]|uniref:Uncharacterized protein n=1 Tax=Pythium oligandrum TaxID=41045 RepID=A0A8K1FG19_PYTOL|nr:hypothetical protein Poli38472_011835 [Pythium oligandrum]|eukprot:TMW58247.1 hypothetical protein Poli38472_011835 [Pythium oligandrum]
MSTDWNGLEGIDAEADGFETLAATLAFIDGNFSPLGGEAPLVTGLNDELPSLFDGHDDVLAVLSMEKKDAVGSEKRETMSPVDKTTQKPTRKWKNTPKQELERLRVTETELKAQLEQLKRKKASNGALSTSESGLWQQIASRQSKERENALVENAKLRDMMEDNIRTVRALERILTKRRSQPELLTWAPEKRMRILTASDPLDDVALEVEMRQMALDMYQELDRICSDPRFQTETMEVPLSITDLGIDNLGRPVVEVIESRLLPFGLHETAEAMWSLWTKKSYGPIKMTRLTKLHVTEDTAERNIEGITEKRFINGQFQAKVVSRRFIKANRVVMTGVVLMQPVAINGMPMKGVYTRTRVWNMVCPTIDSQGNQVTCRQVYNLVSTEAFDSSSPLDEQEQCIDQLKQFVLSNETSKADFIHQALENQLVNKLTKLELE